MRARPFAAPPIYAAPLHAAAVRFTHAPDASAGSVRTRFDVLPPSVVASVPVRRASFVAGRLCAERALRAAGADASSRPLPIGSDGGPCWPEGWIGSITHADGVAVAVAASRASVRAVGIDCERVIAPAVVESIAASVLPEGDRTAIRGGEGASLSWPEFVTLAFSLKESLYKCLRPLVGIFFDFADAELVEVDLGRRTATLRLACDLGGTFVRGRELTGHWVVLDGMVHTAVILLADDDGGARPKPWEELA